jgi:hypothetical protein
MEWALARLEMCSFAGLQTSLIFGVPEDHPVFCQLEAIQETFQVEVSVEG